MKTIFRIAVKRKGTFAIISVFLLFLKSTYLSAQFRQIENQAFEKGEKLVYKVYYNSLLTGNVTAGECIFEIQKNSRVIAQRNTMHVICNGYTKGLFNLFFKVKDRYETFLDEEAMMPWLFIRRINEGGYIKKQDVSFNHYNNTMLFKNVKRNRSNVSSMPQYTQDILSAIYYFRTFDFTQAKEGDAFPVIFTLDDTVYTTNVFYMGKEQIETSIGTVNCFKLKPMLLTGNIFKDPFPMMLWISDDANKIPVLVESEILVGSVKAELIQYSGLKNPMTAKVDKPKDKRK